MTTAPERRPGRWLRVLYRAPLAVYDLGLAGHEHRLGLEWVLIETRGRKTGRIHRVLVDRIGEDASTGRVFVQSAYGANSDWVKNARAAGALWAEVRSERFAARLEVPDDATARRMMIAYVRAHPLYSPFIARMLGYRGSFRDPEQVAAWLVDNFGMLAIART